MVVVPTVTKKVHLVCKPEIKLSNFDPLNANSKFKNIQQLMLVQMFPNFENSFLFLSCGEIIFV